MWTHANSAKLKAAIDAIGVPMFVVDVGAEGFRIAAFNRRHERLTGLSHAACAGRTLEAVLPAHTADTITANLRRCLERRAELEYDEVLDLPAGRTSWHTVLTPVCDRTGAVVRLVGTTTHTTGRKRLDEALQYQNRLLKAQLDTSPDGVLILDRDYRVLAWNQRFLDIWGIPEDRVAVGVPDESVLTLASEQTLDPDAFVNHVQSQQNHPEQPVVADPVRLRDGRTIERYARTLRNQDEHQGRVMFFRDVTARLAAETALRESESRFRQMAEHIRHQVFWIMSPDSDQMLYVSPAYETIWGASCQNLYDDPRSWLRLLLPEDRARMKAAVAAQALTPHGQTYEVRIRRANDGAIRQLRIQAFPVYDDQRRPYRVAGVTEDITPLREAEAQLEEQKGRLRGLERLSFAGEMASGLAHELNQPLAATVIYAQASLNLLRNDPPDTRRLTDLMEKIIAQGLRAGDIIRVLRSFVQRPTPQFEPTDLNGLVRNVLALTEAERRRLGIEAELDLEDGLRPVRADSLQIQQVLLNLLHNAIDAVQTVPNRTPRLHLATRSVDGGMEITVADNGPGTAGKPLERLFQPFYSTKHQGVGLGLWVSRSIVEAHDGTLQAAARPEGGLIFRVHLPITPLSDGERSGSPRT